MEGLFEKELKGQNGCSITIVDSMAIRKNHSKHDCRKWKRYKTNDRFEFAKELYEQFKDDKSCSVAMNQYTGEVLALVSTPSYDNNDLLGACQVKSGMR